MYFFMIALLLTGCAFKGNDPSASTNAITSSSARLADVSWEGNGGSVSIQRQVAGDKNFSISDPISLPPEIPDSLKIVFNAPLVSGKLLDEPRVFISDQTDPKIIAPPLRLKGVLDPSGILISGLKTFFSVNKQQKGVLKISLMNAVTGDEEASLGFSLVTTPTAAQIELISRDTVKDLSVRKLAAPQLRLDLLYAVKITNPNIFRAEFEVPGELKGSIRKNFARHDFEQRQCDTATAVSNWVETYGTRFFVLPLEEGLRGNWISRMGDPARLVTLEPGASRVFGIYASGAQVSSFIDNGCPTLRPSSAHVISNCVRSCFVQAALSLPGGGEIGPPHCQFGYAYADVPSGVESSGAYWVLDSGSTELKARNAFLNQADDPASRSIPFLPGQLTVF